MPHCLGLISFSKVIISQSCANQHISRCQSGSYLASIRQCCNSLVSISFYLSPYNVHRCSLIQLENVAMVMHEYVSVLPPVKPLSWRWLDLYKLKTSRSKGLALFSLYSFNFHLVRLPRRRWHKLIQQSVFSVAGRCTEHLAKHVNVYCFIGFAWK